MVNWIKKAVRIFVDQPSGCAPRRAHEDDAGLDLYNTVPVWIKPHEREAIDTHVRVAIPKGYVGLVLPRSSLSRRGIDSVIGVIDAGYRGTVGVCLVNNTDKTICIDGGDRIAQLVVVPCLLKTKRVHSMELNTSRGTGGFGSTGK